MGHRRLWAVVAGALTLGLAACGGSSGPAPAPSVPVSPSPATAPYTLELTSGSAAGLEGAGTAGAHYWFTAPRASFTLTNNQPTPQTLALTGAMAAPQCATTPTRVQLIAGQAAPTQLSTQAPPQPFSDEVTVPAAGSVRIDFVTQTPACRTASDPRTFYSGVLALAVAPAPAVLLQVGDGVSVNELPPGLAPLNWITAAKATITIVHRHGATSTPVVVSGSVIPPPCPITDLAVTFDAPGQTREVVVLPHGSLGQAFSVPFSVPLGSSLALSVRASTPGCTIKSDARTFYGGIRSLAVGGG